MIFKRRVIVVSFVATFLGLTVIQMVDIQFPVLFRELAPHFPELTGWLMGGSGLGAVVMIIFLNRFETLKHYGWLIGAGMLLVGGGFGGVGFLKEGFNVLYPVFLCFIGGLGVGLLTITPQYIIQKETKEHEIGRVSGIFSSIISFTVLASPLMGGFLVQLFGVILLYLSSGAVLLLIGTVLVTFNTFLFPEQKAEKEIPAVDAK
ncbi:MFS transporter [Bacillus sp. RO2]|uniref:MFS transporter n=1 Tax=Bacillus sp. RO2 TaxID=2723913 RepID=UPI0032162897